MSRVSGPLSRGERDSGRRERSGRTDEREEGEAKKEGEKERGRDKVGLKLSPSCMLLKE